MDKPITKTVGRIDCPTCDRECDLRANKKGHLYIYCDTPGDGGCGTGTTSRSDVGDEKLAARASKWVRPEYRNAYLGETSGDDPDPTEDDFDEPDPDPDPDPASDTAPTPTRPKRKRRSAKPKAAEDDAPISILWD